MLRLDDPAESETMGVLNFPSYWMILPNLKLWVSLIF